MMETKYVQLQAKAELISIVSFLLHLHKTSVAIQSVCWATSYLFYLPAGIDTTAASIFAKLAVHFSEHGVMWSKCKASSIDCARGPHLKWRCWSAFEMALLVRI